MESVATAVQVVEADAADAEDLAGVAARTFPLACPPSVSPENISAFIATNLNADRFASYIADPDRVVLAARADGRIVGYAMLIRGLGTDEDVRRAVRVQQAVEISKMYVLAESHGTGAAAALMAAAGDHATRMGADVVWLGVNQQNQRAQRFYTKHGFAICGTRRFHLRTRIEEDYVMARPL